MMSVMLAESPQTPRSEVLNSTSGRDLRVMRRLLLAILVLGLVGATIDLLLLDHYEDAWQLIPLVLLGLAFVVLGWHVASGSAASIRAFRALMLLFLLGGLTGGVLHFRASAEFHAAMDPSPTRWQLARAVLRSKVPPVLAPAVMLQMGLVGLAYTYRHPALWHGVAGGALGEPK